MAIAALAGFAVLLSAIAFRAVTVTSSESEAVRHDVTRLAQTSPPLTAKVDALPQHSTRVDVEHHTPPPSSALPPAATTAAASPQPLHPRRVDYGF
jgi:hypothetical protein